ncbi:cytidylate kinase [Alicycliphilus sp. B1]|nr:cytidylate kinase [Alicycliphilus sp. B1]
MEAARAMGAQITGGPNWLQIERGSWPLRAIDLDCNHIPDAAMTLAVMALYAQGTTTLRNIASWRVKETDRLAAMACELAKLGASVEEGADYLRITPPARPADWRAPASAPTTTTAWPCASRWRPSTPPACRAHRRPQVRGQDLPRLLRGAVLGRPGRHSPHPGHLHRPHPREGQGSKLARQPLPGLGALYRITALATRAGIAIDQAGEQRIADLARGLPVRFEGERIWLGQDDVTEAIRPRKRA